MQEVSVALTYSGVLEALNVERSPGSGGTDAAYAVELPVGRVSETGPVPGAHLSWS
jgi:hypothetical protein